MRVLVVNAGSSSIKLAVVDGDNRVVESEHVRDWSGDTEALRGFVSDVEFEAVGHRVVHGGWDLTRSTPLRDDVVEGIRAATPLAPMHQTRALDGIDAMRTLRPDVSAVACFDTSFHADLPAASSTYALPKDWREDLGIRRFGFHGLNHAYVARRTAEMLGRDATLLRTVSCHLGSGASLCAIDGGRSVDTTMGFTPLEGLVMSTRGGSIDPGIVTWLVAERGLPVEEVLDRLDNESGLRGLTGGSGDYAHASEAADDGSREARLAVDVYQHRLVGSIAAMAAAMGGLDALVFTAGVGEHAAGLRAAVARRLGFLGVAVDEAVNASCEPDCDVTGPGALVRTLVLEAREDLQIARETRSVLVRDASG